MLNKDRHPCQQITSLNHYNNLNAVNTFIFFYLTWCCNIGTIHAAILLKCNEKVVEIELQSSVACWNYLFALLQYRSCSTAALQYWRKPSICATTRWAKSLWVCAKWCTGSQRFCCGIQTPTTCCSRTRWIEWIPNIRRDANEFRCWCYTTLRSDEQPHKQEKRPSIRQVKQKNLNSGFDFLVLPFSHENRPEYTKTINRKFINRFYDIAVCNELLYS